MTLAMKFRNGVVLLLEALYAVEKRECDLQAVLFCFKIILGSRIIQRALHLADGLDETLRILCEVMFLLCDQIELVVECF